MERAVYLDYNATVPMKPAVIAAVVEAMECLGNASSVHRFGRLARRAVEEARERVAALVGARPEQIVFTSSGTEANNLALHGRERVIVSAIEHDSVLGAAPHAEILPVGADGVVDLEALARLLSRGGKPALVSVLLANNETGVIQPVAEVARLARSHGCLVHCDAVQAAGKIPVDLGSLGVHLVSLSAHKIAGPQGAGALVVADGVEVEPMLRGGGQERGRRAGTEAVAALVGFGVAAELAREGLGDTASLTRLRDDLERRVLGLAPGVKIFGAEAPRVANTSCFTMPGVASETQVMALDLAGVAVSAGAACSSGSWPVDATATTTEPESGLAEAAWAPVTPPSRSRPTSKLPREII
ncbi:MAG: cysteine desulfurase family protein [Alphaproteobacteria bacterium]